MTGSHVAPSSRARGWLIAVAVLALALGAVAAFLEYGSKPHAAARRAAAGPIAQSPGYPSSGPSGAASTAPFGEPSGAPAAPAVTTPPAAGPRSPARPDSAIDPDAVFVDPAATGRHTPPPATAGGPPRCSDWRAELTGAQRIRYSAALLRAAWQNDGSSGSPPRRMVTAYASAITTACRGTNAANDAVADVAHAVYVEDHERWGP
jgi:hypothetical protein